MSNEWQDFNDAEPQFSVIPKGTVVTVRAEITPGGHDDFEMGWSGGYVTRNNNTGSAYLNCQYTVLGGEYANRKLRGNIGLHSPKGTTWGKMGRSFIKAALNSARGILPTDESPRALGARRINSFGDLNGLVFMATVEVETDDKGKAYNTIKTVIEPGDPSYMQPRKRQPPPPPPPPPTSAWNPEADFNDEPF